jgi:hypothetical protein
VFGWTWFPENTNAVVQFVAHTFFYGTVLGYVLNRIYFHRGTPWAGEHARTRAGRWGHRPSTKTATSSSDLRVRSGTTQSSAG